MKKYIKKILALFIILATFISCQDDYQPKPRGYFRIQLPQKEYIRFEHKSFPYSFNMPIYAKITKPRTQAEKYWINVSFPNFKAKLHISYKPIHHNLDTLLNDVHKMMNKHIPKANAINEQMFLNNEINVYGMAYEIKGSEAASPYQFYLTDSTNHFLRGALYFNFSPNNDSLKPVINFLQQDVQELIDSFRWEE
ncbi:MAG: gliding motility lipoprotein GldD [Bacteroidales bacterium]|nr:gliding motility lipoprotein GldD [Bacteroidales bacterium]